MKCAKCGHPKDMHDSDADYRYAQEWCNFEDCQCDCFIESDEGEKLGVMFQTTETDLPATA